MGPPTSGSKAGGPKFSQPRPTVTGWSTDDERIFDREAAKINLKWARRKKNQDVAEQDDSTAAEAAQQELEGTCKKKKM